MFNGKLENTFISGQDKETLKRTRTERQNYEAISNEFREKIVSDFGTDEFKELTTQTNTAVATIAALVKTQSSYLKDISNSLKTLVNILKSSGRFHSLSGNKMGSYVTKGRSSIIENNKDFGQITRGISSLSNVIEKANERADEAITMIGNVPKDISTRLHFFSESILRKNPVLLKIANTLDNTIFAASRWTKKGIKELLGFPPNISMDSFTKIASWNVTGKWERELKLNKSLPLQSIISLLSSIQKETWLLNNETLKGKDSGQKAFDIYDKGGLAKLMETGFGQYFLKPAAKGSLLATILTKGGFATFMSQLSSWTVLPLAKLIFSMSTGMGNLLLSGVTTFPLTSLTAMSGIYAASKVFMNRSRTLAKRKHDQEYQLRKLEGKLKGNEFTPDYNGPSIKGENVREKDRSKSWLGYVKEEWSKDWFNEFSKKGIGGTLKDSFRSIFDSERLRAEREQEETEVEDKAIDKFKRSFLMKIANKQSEVVDAIIHLRDLEFDVKTLRESISGSDNGKLSYDQKRKEEAFKEYEKYLKDTEENSKNETWRFITDKVSSGWDKAKSGWNTSVDFFKKVKGYTSDDYRDIFDNTKDKVKGGWDITKTAVSNLPFQASLIFALASKKIKDLPSAALQLGAKHIVDPALQGIKNWHNEAINGIDNSNLISEGKNLLSQNTNTKNSSKKSFSLAKTIFGYKDENDENPILKLVEAIKSINQKLSLDTGKKGKKGTSSSTRNTNTKNTKTPSLASIIFEYNGKENPILKLVEYTKSINDKLSQNTTSLPGYSGTVNTGSLKNAASKSGSTSSKPKADDNLLFNISNNLYKLTLELAKAQAPNTPNENMLPWRPFKKGGIVNKETKAIIGEAGSEAVIPLDGEQSKPFAKSIAESISEYTADAQTKHGELRAWAAVVEELLQASKEYLKEDAKRTLTDIKEKSVTAATGAAALGVGGVAAGVVGAKALGQGFLDLGKDTASLFKFFTNVSVESAKSTKKTLMPVVTTYTGKLKKFVTETATGKNLLGRTLSKGYVAISEKFDLLHKSFKKNVYPFLKNPLLLMFKDENGMSSLTKWLGRSIVPVLGAALIWFTSSKAFKSSVGKLLANFIPNFAKHGFWGGLWENMKNGGRSLLDLVTGNPIVQHGVNAYAIKKTYNVAGTLGSGGAVLTKAAGTLAAKSGELTMKGTSYGTRIIEEGAKGTKKLLYKGASKFYKGAGKVGSAASNVIKWGGKALPVVGSCVSVVGNTIGTFMDAYHIYDVDKALKAIEDTGDENLIQAAKADVSYAKWKFATSTTVGLLAGLGASATGVGIGVSAGAYGLGQGLTSLAFDIFKPDRNVKPMTDQEFLQERAKRYNFDLNEVDPKDYAQLRSEFVLLESSTASSKLSAYELEKLRYDITVKVGANRLVASTKRWLNEDNSKIFSDEKVIKNLDKFYNIRKAKTTNANVEWLAEEPKVEYRKLHSFLQELDPENGNYTHAWDVLEESEKEKFMKQWYKIYSKADEDTISSEKLKLANEILKAGANARRDRYSKIKKRLQDIEDKKKLLASARRITIDKGWHKVLGLDNTNTFNGSGVNLGVRSTGERTATYNNGKTYTINSDNEDVKKMVGAFDSVNRIMAAEREARANSYNATHTKKLSADQFHLCARGVKKVLLESGMFTAKELWPDNSLGHAYQMASFLSKSKNFSEITNNFDGKRSNLRNAPDGSIIVWDKGPNKPSGHIAIKFGQKEMSDRVRNLILDPNHKYGDFRVFYPSSGAVEEEGTVQKITNGAKTIASKITDVATDAVNSTDVGKQVVKNTKLFMGNDSKTAFLQAVNDIQNSEKYKDSDLVKPLSSTWNLYDSWSKQEGNTLNPSGMKEGSAWYNVSEKMDPTSREFANAVFAKYQGYMKNPGQKLTDIKDTVVNTASEKVSEGVTYVENAVNNLEETTHDGVKELKETMVKGYDKLTTSMDNLATAIKENNNAANVLNETKDKLVAVSNDIKKKAGEMYQSEPVQTVVKYSKNVADATEQKIDDAVQSKPVQTVIKYGQNVTNNITNTYQDYKTKYNLGTYEKQFSDMFSKMDTNYLKGQYLTTLENIKQLKTKLTKTVSAYDKERIKKDLATALTAIHIQFNQLVERGVNSIMPADTSDVEAALNAQ